VLVLGVRRGSRGAEEGARRAPAPCGAGHPALPRREVPWQQQHAGPAAASSSPSSWAHSPPGGRCPGQGCAQAPASWSWPPPRVLGARGKAKVTLPGCPCGAGGRGSASCRPPVPRSCVESLGTSARGTPAPRVERRPVPGVRFVSYNKQIRAAFLLAVPGWGQLPSACITQIYCVILERCLSLAGCFKSFLERAGLWERGHRNPL